MFVRRASRGPAIQPTRRRFVLAAICLVGSIGTHASPERCMCVGPRFAFLPLRGDPATPCASIKHDLRGRQISHARAHWSLVCAHWSFDGADLLARIAAVVRTQKRKRMAWNLLIWAGSPPCQGEASNIQQ